MQKLFYNNNEYNSSVYFLQCILWPKSSIELSNCTPDKRKKMRFLYNANTMPR